MIFKQDESRRGYVYGPIENVDKFPAAEGVKVTGDSVRFAKASFESERDCEDWLRKNSGEDVLHVKNLIVQTKAIELNDAEWEQMLPYITNPENVKREDFRIYRSWLANSVVDRDRERFPVSVLNQFAETLPGKSKLINHNWYEGEPEGRYYAAEVVKVTNAEMLSMCGTTPITNFSGLVKQAEEKDGGLYWLVGKFYVPAADAELLFKIDSGIYSFESIGFRAPRIEPVEDNEGNIFWWEWQSNSVRTAEATEGSWVFLGAQYGARTGKSAINGQIGKGLSIDDIEDMFEQVLDKRLNPKTEKPPEPNKPKENGQMLKFKIAEAEFEVDPANAESVQEMTDAIEAKFTQADEEAKTLRDEKAAMEKVLTAAGLTQDSTEEEAKVMSEDAKAYRESVVTEAMKFGQLTGAIPTEEEEAKAHRETLEKLGTEEIKRTGDGYKAIYEKANPPQGQIKTDQGKGDESEYDPEAPNSYLTAVPA